MEDQEDNERGGQPMALGILTEEEQAEARAAAAEAAHDKSEDKPPKEAGGKESGPTTGDVPSASRQKDGLSGEELMELLLTLLPGRHQEETLQSMPS